jgi:hypothetical protein
MHNKKEENDRTSLLYLFPSLYFYWARNRKTLAETSFIPHDLSLTSQTLSQILKLIEGLIKRLVTWLTKLIK